MFKENDKWAFIKKLFSKLDEAYTQRSRTNNKLDEVIKLLKSGLNQQVIRSGHYSSGSVQPPIPTRGSTKSIRPLQPHVRIEFDDINDVPKVYIDGKDVTDVKNNHSALQELHVDWLTDTDHERSKSYEVQVCDDNGSYVFSNEHRHQVGDIVKLTYKFDKSGKPYSCGKVILTEDGWRVMNTNVYLPSSEVHEHEVQ